MSNTVNDKLVSIIVPAYNVEKYINECLESLLAQTYRNIEIIVVDDGSHDHTWDIVTEFMEKDQRIRGYHQENKGVSGARNSGLDIARGDYIQFVDGDDYIPEKAVETLVRALESENADWVNCQYCRVDESGNPLENYNFTKGFIDISNEERKVAFIRDLLIEYLVGYEIWNKLYIGKFIRDCNLKFDDNCRMGEDLEFNIRYCLLTRNILCIEDRLYSYRVRGGSAMQSITTLSDNFNERLLIIREIERPVISFLTGDNKRVFSLIFFKLMIFVCKGYTTEEIAAVAARAPGKDYFIQQLSKALEMKEAFSEFFYEDIALLYWRVGYYILSSLTGSKKGKLYFVFYDLYRRIRGREVISEWKLI